MGWLIRSALVVIPLWSLIGCAADTTAPLPLDSGPAGISIKATPNTLKGAVGVPFAGGAGVVFSVSGGTAGAVYYWTVTGLPPGLIGFPPDNLNPSGTLTIFGAPSEGGQFPLQISVHTAPNHTLLVSGANFPIEISGDSNSPPAIPQTSLTWLTGVTYQQALTATGGKTPYTSWFATGLPPGITLDAQSGTLSGTASTPNTYNVTVSVLDAAGRTGTGTVIITVKTWTLADAKGTWTGVIQTGPLANKRLSLLFNDVGVAQQGTLDTTILATTAQSLQFTLNTAGQFDGQVAKISWHLVCAPVASGDLDCIGHSYNGTSSDGSVTLSKINATSQDPLVPTVVSSSFTNGATSGTGQVTVIFSELMSGTGTPNTSITLSGGSGTIGPPTFVGTDPTSTDARTLTIPLSKLQASTSYVLTLNPTGQTGFLDLTGNVLGTKAITFTTGATGGNQPPTATPLTLSAAMGASRAITLTGFDPEGSPLIFTVKTQPTPGTLTGTAPDLTYTPNAIGRDSFTFTVSDGSLTSAAATVTIDTRAANTAPRATPQPNVSVVHDTPLAITLAGTDDDAGDFLTAYTIFSNPAHGTLTGTGAAKTYMPNAGYVGSDFFYFTVTDSAGAVSVLPARVTIDVTNQAPTATPQSKTVQKEVPTPITLVGTDLDGDIVTYTVVDSTPSATHGTLTPTGTAGANRTYTPPVGYSGPYPLADSFTFTVNDGIVDSAAATVTIKVSGNPPPTADAQTMTFETRQPTTPYNKAQWAIILTGSGASAVTFKIVTWPGHGSLTEVAFTQGTTYYTGYDLATYTHSSVTATTSSSVNITTGDITVSPSGSPSWVVYIPNICHDPFPQDTFTFVAIDADGLTSAPATVTMTSATYDSCAHF
ncbi:MAG: cadherin-like domain-containing protein [Nitrospirae bacterium]|nr:cadherin-like domain-containing protein [Nitrospirota bacterium]